MLVKPVLPVLALLSMVGNGIVSAAESVSVCSKHFVAQYLLLAIPFTTCALANSLASINHYLANRKLAVPKRSRTARRRPK